MSHLAIADLNFLEAALPDRWEIKGSGINTPNLLPTVATALSTDLKTASFADYNVTGSLEDGFKVNILSLAGGAAAAAAATSIGGNATVVTKTWT